MFKRDSLKLTTDFSSESGHGAMEKLSIVGIVALRGFDFGYFNHFSMAPLSDWKKKFVVNF